MTEIKAITSAKITGAIGIRTPSGNIEITINTSVNPKDLFDAFNLSNFDDAVQDWLEEFVADYKDNFAELQAKIAEAKKEDEDIVSFVALDSSTSDQVPSDWTPDPARSVVDASMAGVISEDLPDNVEE